MTSPDSNVKLPLVAIVGRPNTGKSTLFNRLMRENRAIVDDVPGTTRDRISGDVSWRDYTFTLVDTGGIDVEATGDIAAMTLEHAKIAISGADVIIFVVDAKDGPIASDQEVSEVLRMSGRPVVLAANKADTAARERNTVEFYELGLGDPVAISAYHGIGITDLMTRVTSFLPKAMAEVGEEPLKIAVVGRPNVGKSMLVNAVLGEERVIVSPVPGTTRDAIDTPFVYNGKPILLIDTAGLRRRGRIGRGVERYSVMRAMKAIERAEVVALVTEPEELMSSQDMHIAGFAQESYKSLVVAVNKWDLSGDLGAGPADAIATIRSKLRFLPQVYIAFVSAKYRQGLDRLLELVLEAGEERRRRVPTAVLNDLAHEIFLAHTPSQRGKLAKLYYATQAQVDPPTFVFFVNDPTLIHFSHRRYIENRLREAFGFRATPLNLLFRGRRES